MGKTLRVVDGAKDTTGPDAMATTARGSSVFLTFLRNPGGSFRWAELANRCLAAKWVDDGSPVEFEQRDDILLLKGLSWRAPGRVVELSVEGRPETLCPQTTFWIPE